MIIEKLRKKGNGLIGNVMINTIATAIPVFLIQLIILPYIAGKFDAEQNGLIITLIAVLNTVPATLGNSLNNIRLLYRNEYEQRKIVGDFNIFFLLETLINVVVVGVLFVYYLYSDEILSASSHLVLLLILSVLFLGREYFIVGFLLELRYDRILINNVLLAIGYIIGLFFFNKSGYWEFVYIIGYVFSLIYIFINTNIWREPIRKTILFNKIMRENLIYIASCFLYRLISYADKMVLYPILGGAQTTIYYVATLVAKIISLLITPLNSVMLGYLSKEKEKNEKQFSLILKTGICVCVIGYLVCTLVSRPVFSLLYPQYVSEAMKYIYITNATTMVGLMISLINPYILRFFSMKWQMIINSVTVVVYVVVSLTLLVIWELFGFCLGGLLCNIVKLFVMIFIYYKAEERITIIQ